MPQLMALGFAAYIVFMKTAQNENGEFSGMSNNMTYTVNDDKAGKLYAHWQQKDIETVVQNIFADETLWTTDLNQLPGFTDIVTQNTQSIINSGVKKLIQSIR